MVSPLLLVLLAVRPLPHHGAAPLPTGAPCAGGGDAVVVAPPAYPFPADTVLGVRADPLDAYADLIPSLYPYGVPIDESGAALQTLREARLLQAYEHVAPNAGTVVPPNVVPPNVVRPAVASPRLATPAVAPPAAVPFGVRAISRDGLNAEAIEVELPLPPGSSGTVTLTVIGHRRDLIPAAGPRVLEARREPVELTQATRPIAGSRYVVPIRSLPLGVADDADVFVRVRIAGVGVAEGFAGTVALRTVAPTQAARLTTDGTLKRNAALSTQPRRRLPGVVLSSERPQRQAVQPSFSP